MGSESKRFREHFCGDVLLNNLLSEDLPTFSAGDLQTGDAQGRWSQDCVLPGLLQGSGKKKKKKLKRGKRNSKVGLEGRGERRGKGLSP